VSVSTATPPIVVVFVAPAIEAPSSEESGTHNIKNRLEDGFVNVAGGLFVHAFAT
jgi:hypothetical protein